MYKIVFPAILFFLSGCSSIPRTIEDLQKTGIKSDPYCYDEKIEIVANRIQTYLKKCFKEGYVSYTAGGFLNEYKVYDGVIESKEDEKIAYTAYMDNAAGLAYGLRVEIEEGEPQCPTRMDAIAMNRFWIPKIKKVDLAIQGKNPSCFSLM